MRPAVLVLVGLLVISVSCAPNIQPQAPTATATSGPAASAPVPTETRGATASAAQESADSPAPPSGGSSTGSEVADYLSWYHDNGLAAVLEMGRTLAELDKRMSQYDVAGMCELPRPDPTRFRDQLIAKPAPKRVAALRDKTLQLFSEFEQAESGVAKYCATIDTDALGRAADHINKFTSIAEQLTSELSALGAEYGLR